MAQCSLWEEKPYCLYLPQEIPTAERRKRWQETCETEEHGHACECETSISLANHAHLVKMDRVRDERKVNMNVIVVMLDSLRTDHLSAYAGEKAKARTPHMDRFTASAQVYERMYVGSYPTLPCRRDLFTGRWGHPFNTWGEMERDLPTLADRLRSAGYVTGLVHDTPMFLTQGTYLDRGFGSIEWIRGQGGEPWISDGLVDIKLPAAESKVKVEALKRYLMNQTRRMFESDYLVARVMTEAIRWLERNYTQNQFFLWIDSWDPHEPWDPPAYYVDLYDPGYEGEEVIFPWYGFSRDIMSERELEHVKAMYAAEVTMVDRWFGQLLETIELLRLMENTVVVLMSDHGHYFGDHGLQGKPWGDLGQLYEPITQLVFAVSYPGSPPSRCAELVQPVDLFPTVCDLVRLDAPGGMQGHSFAPLVRGEGGKVREYAISGRNLDDPWGTVPATVTDGVWTLVYWPNKDLQYKNPPVRMEPYSHIGMPERRVDELFHMPDDPGQEKNVIGKHPEKAKWLHRALLELIADCDVEPAIAETYRPLPGDNYHLR